MDKTSPAHKLGCFWNLSHFWLIAALFWGWVMLGALVPESYVLWHADGYRPAKFRIGSLYFEKHGGHDGAGPAYWAEGTVEPPGARERMAIDFLFDEEPKSREDIERRLTINDVMPVFYNSSLSDDMAFVRVILDEGDGLSRIRKRRAAALKWTLIPLVPAIVCVIIARRLAGSGPLITLGFGSVRQKPRGV